MTSSFIYDAAFVKSVFHPSDFSAASENAFAHALAIAFMRSTELTILHAGGSTKEWQLYPAVRRILERWRLLEERNRQSQVFEELSVRVKKSQGAKRQSCVRYARDIWQNTRQIESYSPQKVETECRNGSDHQRERIALKSESKTLLPE